MDLCYNVKKLNLNEVIIMKKTQITQPFRPVYPSPAGLIVSIDSLGNPNVMTAGEIFNISLKSPCIIGIALRKATYTHELITESKEFSVNFPTVNQLELMDLVGTISGREGMDKLKEYDIKTTNSETIKSPIITDCPVNLECKMLSVQEVGDHDLFLGEVTMMHVDADKINEKNQIEIEKVDSFAFGEWGYYRIAEKIGDFGFSRRTKQL